MDYKFYGWQDADVTPKDKRYEKIKDAREFYDLLSEYGWSAQTCAPRMSKEWTKENKTLGQCSITSFLVQDIFGGKVYGIPLPDGNYHCYNDVDGHIFDLTSEQFGKEILCYANNPEQFREVHFENTDKRERYELLRQKLNEKLNIKD